MKINHSPVKPSERNAKAKKSFKMKLSENASGHLIHALINQYADGVAAVIREYSSNARDAHIDAGKTDVPIEVWLPTEESPTLKIRDHGTGLDEKGLETYVELGESGKRDSNTQTGAWGLGCKSGLAVAEHFNVISIKDGIKRFCVVGGNEHGELSLDIFKELETDEPNGVEVRIPFDPARNYEIRGKAEEFFSFWDRGSVLVDGVEPKNWLDYSGDHYITEYGEVSAQNYANRGISVAMGNVAYPVNLDTLKSHLDIRARGAALHGFSYSTGVLLRADIGDLDLVPSRDSLNYTERTVKNVLSLLNKTENSVIEKVEEETSSATSFADAERKIRRSQRVLNDAPDVLFKGKKYDPFVRGVGANGGEYLLGRVTGPRSFGSAATIDPVERQRFMLLPYSDNGDKRTLVVFDKENYPMGSFKVTSWKRKFAEWMEEEGVSSLSYAAGDINTDNPWIFDNDNINIVSAADIDAKVKEMRREARAARKAAGITGSVAKREVRYEMTFGGTVSHREIALSDLPDSITTLYYTNGGGVRHVYVSLISNTDDAAFVRITGNRNPDIFIKRAEEAGKTVVPAQDFTSIVKNKARANKVAQKAVAAKFKRSSVPHGIFSQILSYMESTYNTDDSVKEVAKNTTVCGVSIADLVEEASFDRSNLSTDEDLMVSIALGELYEEMSQGLEGYDLPDRQKVYETYPMIAVASGFYGDSAGRILEYIGMVNELNEYRSA